MVEDKDSGKLNFAPGDLIFKTGDPGDSFFLIEEGEVEIFIEDSKNDTEIKIASVKKGETLGELSVLTHMERNACARAIMPVVVTRITAVEYAERIQTLPDWTLAFLTSLARRIQATNNRVSEEYFRSLEAAVERARMGKELQIAKAVQDTLFPTNEHSFGNLEVVGHFESASECGGDWWYVCEHDEKVYLWLGDATGHGVSAALITSAARAVVSVLQNSKTLSPRTALETLNRSIFDTSKGKVMMTFFVASIDRETSELVYANASQEPVYVCRSIDSVDKKYEMISLDQVNNSRLGEDPESEYEQATFQLRKGDFVLAYTDGVTGAVNPNQSVWGPRNLLKSFTQAVEQCKNALEVADYLKSRVADFRKTAPLVDDVTFFVLHHQDQLN